ncbi:MAG TPA: putative baseplate assembly protein [Pseudacidobacterium sp.]|nr:putative baseplate assembly protein [Pseudacidobacterium sp.]
MNGECVIQDQQLCGCCEGMGRETPQVIYNRPALSAIVYRAGTYSSFRASLLASLSDPDYPALALLRTRDSSDFTIALLDAWSVVCDILTFYQERSANEAWLRTAVDQRSVFELARLVGYVPSRGVAASDILAFTLSSAPGSPDNVLIPTGTRVQSIPGPGQTPQVFETSADLTAVIAWNALPAQTARPWQLSPSDTSTWIEGTANNISVGDALLFVSSAAGKPPSKNIGDVHYVTHVFVDPDAKRTKITWDNTFTSELQGALDNVSVYVFRRKAALYGVQAPAMPLIPNGENSGIDATKITGYVAGGTDWDFTRTFKENSGQINLDASYSGLEAGQWVVLTGLGYTSFFQITAAPSESNPNAFTLTTKTTQLTLDLGEIIYGDKALSLNEVLWEFVKETRDITAYIQSVQLTPTTLPLTGWALDGSYTKQSGMLAPVEGTTLSIVGGQKIASNQPIGVSGKRVRLQVVTGASAIFTPANAAGALTVSDGQIFLIDSFPPVNDLWSVITLSGVPGSLLTDTGNVTLLPSDSGDPTVGEAAIVQSTSVQGDTTTLSLVQPLGRIYDRATVNVNANAVDATHGETVQEILGNGDATNDALEFTLKQAPLTYVSASSGNGSQSTLEVWVNNLQWHEVPNFLSSGPADRVFVTRVNAAGNVVIQFGNGTNGSRTPTGQANIRAVYRKGIGIAGMVQAGQLSQPLDRPQGLKSATNPSPASGAADPASSDDARTSAPLPTLTLNRIVSLEDYQNYALAFAGIAKALATWTWFGNTRGVYLTVAGENGAVLHPDDDIITHLVQALRSQGNPYVPLKVVSYAPTLFTFTAKIRVDSDYSPPLVLADVWQNVSNAFSFRARQPGQNVVASEIIELMQQTPGVVAVQLQSLGLSGEPLSSIVPPVLCASSPTVRSLVPIFRFPLRRFSTLTFLHPTTVNQAPQPAQMLLIDPATIGNLGVWS